MLILIRGLPGSGKSSFASKIFSQIVHLENDMFHMIYDSTIFPKFKYNFINERSQEKSRDCFYITKKLLECETSVVVSNVFATKKSIDRYVDLAKTRGHDVKIFRMTNDFGNVHDVPEDALKWMKDNFVDYPGEYFVKSFVHSFVIKDQNGNLTQYNC